MQPFGRTEGDRCGQLDAMHAADPLEVVLLQPPIAADRDDAGHLPDGGAGQGRHQVVDVAELPPRPRPAEHQQPRRLEVTGQRVSAPAPTTIAGRTIVTVMPGWLRGRPRTEPLDLEQVGEQADLRRCAQRRVLGQRYEVVRVRAVHHRAGQQHDPRPTPAAAAAVTTVCVPRTLRDVRASGSRRRTGRCRRGPRRRRRPAARQASGCGHRGRATSPLGVAAVIVERHHPTDAIVMRTAAGRAVRRCCPRLR